MYFQTTQDGWNLNVSLCINHEKVWSTVTACGHSMISYVLHPYIRTQKEPAQNKEIHLKRADICKHYTQQRPDMGHIFLKDVTT
jgi:hypothetical protein